MTTNTMRERFEAWLRSIWTDGYACPKNNDGSYKDPAAQRFWQCWNAALLSAHSAPAPEIPEEVLREQEGLNHPATQVFFRAGLLACREYMARFVEHESPTIAASIRANWWPTLGQDFGAPRKLEWSELTEGEYGEEGFRAKTADEISPTQEALPIALQFLLSLDPGYRRATIDMGMERSIKRELDASPYPPQAVVTLPALTANECAIAAPTAPAVVPLTPMERSVVCALMSVAHDAFYALDDAEESKAKAALGESYHVLCSALDVLDEFPDDKPGYTLDGPGRARWALRRLLGDNYEPKNAEPCNAAPAQAEQQAKPCGCSRTEGEVCAKCTTPDEQKAAFGWPWGPSEPTTKMLREMAYELNLVPRGEVVCVPFLDILRKQYKAAYSAARAEGNAQAEQHRAPFLPCPICNGVEGCDHTVPERRRPALSNIPQPVDGHLSGASVILDFESDAAAERFHNLAASNTFIAQSIAAHAQAEQHRALSDEQRQALGEALSDYFDKLDSHQPKNRRILHIWDHCDARNIDDLIDTAIAPVLASSPECGEAGWEALRDVIRCLRETGAYQDEEGESTYALEDLLIGHMGMLDWAVSRWKAEVANRPLVNVHRRTLDETWRQVIRHCGGDDEALLGPRHSDLVASATPPAQPAQDIHKLILDYGRACHESTSWQAMNAACEKLKAAIEARASASPAPSGDAREVLPTLKRVALIREALAHVKQVYSPECNEMATRREYVEDAVAQLIDAGYRIDRESDHADD